jgi:anti-sigma factor RsiW
MNCDEARPLVGASVDRELSAGDEWRLREHLAGCADCRRVAESVRVLGQAVRIAPYYRAPAALGAKIAAAPGPAAEVAGRQMPAVSEDEVASAEAIAVAASPGGATRAGEPPPRRRRSGWRGLLWPSAGGGARASGGGGYAATAGSRAATPAGWMEVALLVLAALGAAIALNLRGSSADNGAFVDELVASHVRAQLSGRALDVPSSDRHTVKPWFNGRIDYSPPVEDLAAAGFPLAGGRLDYVGRERVAVLVYHYRLHVIDVYVFPPTARAASAVVAPHERDGFALARWKRAGMTWWAVTDAEPDALTAFRTALDARLGDGK